MKKRIVEFAGGNISGLYSETLPDGRAVLTEVDGHYNDKGGAGSRYGERRRYYKNMDNLKKAVDRMAAEYGWNE
jgi:hypothetical protein